MQKNVIIILVSAVIIITGIFYFAGKANKDESKAMPKVSKEQTSQKAEESVETDMSAGYVDIEPAEAYQLIMDTPALVILDVSPRFDKGHLPGAINHYIGDGSLDKAIPSPDKNKTYLVYCHVDSASIPGAQKLVDAGFPKVYRLKGNYGPWLSGGYPIEVEIKAVGSYSGTALAERSYLQGKFKHSVNAKLNDPAAGKFYEGWLVKGASFFSTGKMEKQNGVYALSYESDEDRRDYKKIVITEETEASGLDGKPEAHVLEGEFE